MTKQYIKLVFNYYKTEYRLNTTLRFRLEKDLLGCGFRSDKDKIYFAFPFLFNYYTKQRKCQECLFAILHEIKHAIDYKYDKKRIKKERENTDNLLYITDATYWKKQPYEKRANEFAEKEIKKWKGFNKYENKKTI